ncbi:hypothetical protein [Phenylobacterium sp.]|uniref:hypothetical protein n=1 Tax=Phenylobacterium sp. TaxID=1871053 RepID=UPI002869F670|nr:hypothetical protein [Phenylobacterium sp.]
MTKSHSGAGGRPAPRRWRDLPGVSLLSIASLAGATVSTAATAADTPAGSLMLKAGAAYDDNVSNSQIDTATGRGDSIKTLGLNAKYRLYDDKKNHVSIGYEFNQSLHTRLHGFDIQSHVVSFDASRKFGSSTLVIDYSRDYIIFGGSPFLSIEIVNPSIFTPIRSNIFVRGSYLILNESFSKDRRRNAVHQQPELQAFYFFDHSKAYVLLSGNYQREMTSGPEFSYGGYGLSANLALPVNLLKQKGKIKFGYDFIRRDYNNITPSIKSIREDQWSVVKARLEFPVSSKILFSIDYKYSDRYSNLPSAASKEGLLTTEFSYKF